MVHSPAHSDTGPGPCFKAHVRNDEYTCWLHMHACPCCARECVRACKPTTTHHLHPRRLYVCTYTPKVVTVHRAVRANNRYLGATPLACTAALLLVHTTRLGPSPGPGAGYAHDMTRGQPWTCPYLCCNTRTHLSLVAAFSRPTRAMGTSRDENGLGTVGYH